jgi:hypothetical protein
VASSDAIAYFGDTLVKLLQDGLKDLLAPAEIFLSTLSDFKNSTMSEPTVTVFLYDVGTSGGTRTVSTGAIGGATPSDPLDLHLLITPWAPVTRDAYVLTGAIIALLYAHPIFTPEELLGPQGTWAPGDTVEISLESLSIENQCCIWKAIGVPYRLSLAYLARGIRIGPAPALMAKTK